MPSSISNSKKRKNNWWLTWLVAAAMLLLTLGIYESFLFSKGFKPSVEVNKDLWSWNRRSVQNNPDVIALVGASRIQLGLNTAAMRSRLNNHVIVPLAINGQYPMSTLKSLAEDETFNGLVVMSFMAQMLEPQYMEMQLAYNQYFAQSSSLYLSFDAYLTAILKSKLRFLHPLLGLSDLVEYIDAKKSFPEPFYASSYPDTSAAGDYSLVDVGPLKQHFIDDKKTNYQAYQVMDKSTWLVQIKTLSQYINTIQARGGQVVLVRFPTDDEHWLLDNEYYPRSEFWDVMVESMPQLNTIHFKDDAILSSFELPDSSHLDVTDTEAFSWRLIDLFKQMGLID